MKVELATTDMDIERCFPVMLQLRTHILRDDFVERVRRQAGRGYQLAYLEDQNCVVAVAGFRVSECLAWGRHLYVDDLVTDQTQRSRGYGDRLFAWLVEFARRHDCKQLHLDSGVQRFEAHRFYLHNKMRIASHHFSMSFTDE